MTLVGKILTFMITVCSLVFLGLAIAVFSTQTDWKQRYDAETAKLQALNKEKNDLQLRADELKKQLEEQIAQHKTDRETFLAQIRNQQKNYNDLLERYAEAQRAVVQYREQAQIALAEAEARREEVMKPDVGLRDQLARARGEKEQAIKKQFEAEQQRIELQGQYETVLAHNQELEQRMAELQAVLASYGLPTEPKEKTQVVLENPPPVEGIVTEVQSEGRYIRVSIGSDDGLRPGHRLEVYRLKPNSKYVGRIELTQVDPDYSVGRILPQYRRGTIQEGDLVASPNQLTASR